jgi:K+-transporting ATPase ATPase C chain
MNAYLRPALVLLLLFTLLLGGAYPLAITGIGQLLFSKQASGSLLERDGKLIGSALLGQNFAEPRYFHGRPSAAGASGYDAAASSGSNYGPSSKILQARIAGDLARLQAENPGTPVPADLVTASASGLDPDISPEGALFQVPRVARARGLSEDAVRQLVAVHTQGRWLGILGEPRVNVLALNLALDEHALRR